MRVLDIADERWLDFVSRQPEATIFHHPAWGTLLGDCYGYAAKVVALTEGDGTVIAGLPIIDVSLPLGRRRWVSLPFTDHCPPLAGGHAADLVGGLRDVARTFKVSSLEIRAPLPAAPGVHSDTAFVRHALALSRDVRATWKGLRRNHRRSVADAEEAGVRVTRGDTAADLETFYRIHLQTRRRLGVPIQPRRFFGLLLERILRPGLGFVLTASVGDRPAAAAVFSGWNGTLMCKYSGRADGFTKLDGIHLLFWDAIRSASENGYHTFDLGRSELHQTALRSFKTGWKADETPLAYSWVATRARRPSSRRIQDALAVAIRNSAPWLCRATGELLYRFAA